MHSSSESELQRIIKSCQKWERSSQNELYRRFYAYGMSICIRYVEQEDEAISILNDAFLKVFQNIKSFNLEQEFKPWLRRIIVNTAINHIRDYKKFKQEINMEAAKNEMTSEDVLSLIAYKELLALVQSLSLAYRTVFNMYVIDGFKHEEIATQLGISVSTSKSNLARARVILKQLIIEKLNTRYA
ncbi:MAG: RNA polymerase sigma factor [Saprospiraceae bacterium]|nr:RNA polymerase sigma factor [Saprospiraceae bacterium]